MSTDGNIFKNLKVVDPLTMTFTLSPTDVSYANTLRRAVLSEVESVGFRSDILQDGSTSDVRVIKNNTPMTNEMLADRVGLVPIFADPKEWVTQGLEKKLIFKLNKKSESELPTDVYASDFQVFETTGEEEKPLVGGNKKFFHSDPYMLAKFPEESYTPLITTLKGTQANQIPQEIILEAVATVGKGRDHVRFSPVSQCSYKYTIDTNEEKQKEVFDRWLITTKKVNPSEAKDQRGEMLQREFKTMEIERCYLKDENDAPYSYDFTVESKGQLPVQLIVARALEAMIAKCKMYSTIDKGDLPANITIQPADWTGIGFDFVIAEEDHTLGNLLQTYMDAHMMPDSKGKNGRITYVGYKIPHPLRDEMVFRIGFTSFADKEKTTMLAARAVFADAARECMKMFEQWLVYWNAALEGKAVAGPAAPKAKKQFKVAAAASTATQEQAAPATKGISAEQPEPKVDQRRGTFWKKNPL